MHHFTTAHPEIKISSTTFIFSTKMPIYFSKLPQEIAIRNFMWKWSYNIWHLNALRSEHWQCYTYYCQLNVTIALGVCVWSHDDVIKWKHFPRYWPFVRGIYRPPLNSPQKKWRGALMFSLICVWINGWVNNREAGDLRRHRAHYDVTVMLCFLHTQTCISNMMGHF